MYYLQCSMSEWSPGILQATLAHAVFLLYHRTVLCVRVRYSVCV